LGEDLCGFVTFHNVYVNGELKHQNVKGKKLIGAVTGKVYRITNVQNLNGKGMEMIVRTTGENGLVTYYTLLINPYKEVFLCR